MEKDGEPEQFEFVLLHFLQGVSAHLLLLPILMAMMSLAEMRSMAKRAETCAR